MSDQKTAELERLSINQILAERARVLAKPLPLEEDFASALTTVTCTIAGEEYALEASFVQDIQYIPEITLVPCTPSFVAGIANLRGRLVTILDIRRFLGIDQGISPDYKNIIVVEGSGLRVGLLVDLVSSVEIFPSKTLRPPSGNLIGLRADYISALLPDMRALINLPALLGCPDLIVSEEV